MVNAIYRLESLKANSSDDFQKRQLAAAAIWLISKWPVLIGAEGWKKRRHQLPPLGALDQSPALSIWLVGLAHQIGGGENSPTNSRSGQWTHKMTTANIQICSSRLFATLSRLIAFHGKWTLNVTWLLIHLHLNASSTNEFFILNWIHLICIYKAYGLKRPLGGSSVCPLIFSRKIFRKIFFWRKKNENIDAANVYWNNINPIGLAEGLVGTFSRRPQTKPEKADQTQLWTRPSALEQAPHHRRILERSRS